MSNHKSIGSVERDIDNIYAILNRIEEKLAGYKQGTEVTSDVLGKARIEHPDKNVSILSIKTKYGWKKTTLTGE